MLDLGSGGGIDVILSAKRVGPTGTAYGLDMTDEMLALARANAAEAGVTNVHFLKGVIEQIPLPADSVDVVISNCVINLSIDKPAVLDRDRARAQAGRPDRDQRRRRRGPPHARPSAPSAAATSAASPARSRRASTRRASRRPGSRTIASSSRTRSPTGCTARSSRRVKTSEAKGLPVIQPAATRLLRARVARGARRAAVADAEVGPAAALLALDQAGLQRAPSGGG